MADTEPTQSQVAESPGADIYEDRHRSDSEKIWAEKALNPTLDKAPEKPIGAASGVNLDEHGHARFTTISGVPIRRLYTEADLPEDWDYEKYLGYPGRTAVYPRHPRHGISRQAFHHAPILRVSLRRKKPTSATAICWNRAAAGFQSPSICRR